LIFFSSLPFWTFCNSLFLYLVVCCKKCEKSNRFEKIKSIWKIKSKIDFTFFDTPCSEISSSSFPICFQDFPDIDMHLRIQITFFIFLIIFMGNGQGENLKKKSNRFLIWLNQIDLINQVDLIYFDLIFHWIQSKRIKICRIFFFRKSGKCTILTILWRVALCTVGKCSNFSNILIWLFLGPKNLTSTFWNKIRKFFSILVPKSSEMTFRSILGSKTEKSFLILFQKVEVKFLDPKNSQIKIFEKFEHFPPVRTVLDVTEWSK